MYKRLYTPLIISKSVVSNLLMYKYRMHNLYAIFAKILNTCKQLAGNLVNESGNVTRRGVVPKFSDLEVVTLNMAPEAAGIDSESLLFAKLREYSDELPNLISRRQYNDRRKTTSSLVLPGLSGKLAHLLSCNILTTKMTDLLAELNMHYFNSANGYFTMKLVSFPKRLYKLIPIYRESFCSSPSNILRPGYLSSDIWYDDIFMTSLTMPW